MFDFVDVAKPNLSFGLRSYVADDFVRPRLLLQKRLLQLAIPRRLGLGSISSNAVSLPMRLILIILPRSLDVEALVWRIWD